jgi:hypothetical protein
MWAWLALDFAQRRQIVRISPIGAPLYRRADACHRPQVGERQFSVYDCIISQRD